MRRKENNIWIVNYVNWLEGEVFFSLSLVFKLMLFPYRSSFLLNSSLLPWLMCLNEIQKDNIITETTHSFVRSIRTIWFSIATPFVGYAKIIRTFEIGFWRTGSWWTSLFIARIAAIIITVTAPTFLYATTISTSKFIRATGFV